MPLNIQPFCPVEEVIHGVPVSDRYRWLEDRSLLETKHWIELQKEQCNAYFSSCDTLKALRSRVKEFLNVEVVDQPVKVGGYYFYRRRNRDQEQACIYVQETDTAVERLLVDPSDEGPFTSVRIHCIADDAALLAYEVKHGGGDTKDIRIVDVGGARILPDSTGTGYARGFAFDSGKDGFYYCQESANATGDHLILFHPFFGPVEDRAIFTKARVPGSRLVLIADATRLGAIWIHGHGAAAVCDLFVASRDRDDDWQPVFLNKHVPHLPILHSGRIFVLSYESTPNGQIIELAPDGREIHTVVRKNEIQPQQIVIAGARFFVNCLRNARSSIHSWTLEGEDTGDIDIPTDGSIQLLPQLSSPGASMFYAHESFTQPLRLFEYNTGIEKSSPLFHHVPPRDPDSLKVRALSFFGKDGTAIPITLVGCNEATHTSIQPAIMTSYGGFGVPMTPKFSVLATIMMELGAVFVLPHIRGGGEFGKSWHDAGRARNRQTAIDDFISSAEWLCAEGITAPSKLAIFGGSNSGLLVGAAMTQRPDLFHAVLCIAPLLDMVRYERFDQAVKWQLEYGSVDSAEDFHALHAYSPYHNIEENVDYPATLFVSGDSDDRCNPAHVRKMAASLQQRAAQCNPILVDYSSERGHSPVLPLSVRIDALSLRLAFLCRELQIEVPQEACHEAADSSELLALGPD
jgi:prolyl oligopeptidase